MSDKIRAKYPLKAAQAFRVGQDAGLLLFYDKVLNDHESAHRVYVSQHPELGIDASRVTLQNQMMGNMEEAAQRMNRQVKEWGLPFQFGRNFTAEVGAGSGKFITATLPIEARSPEIAAFITKIENYLQP